MPSYLTEEPPFKEKEEEKRRRKEAPVPHHPERIITNHILTDFLSACHLLKSQ